MTREEIASNHMLEAIRILDRGAKAKTTLEMTKCIQASAQQLRMASIALMRAVRKIDGGNHDGAQRAASPHP